MSDFHVNRVNEGMELRGGCGCRACNHHTLQCSYLFLLLSPLPLQSPYKASGLNLFLFHSLSLTGWLTDLARSLAYLTYLCVCEL